MKCFIFFNHAGASLPLICETDPFHDLVEHLLKSGISEIYSDFPGELEHVTNMDFASARSILESDWIAAYHSGLHRQNPMELRKKGHELGAKLALSLACSSKPWENTTVFTGARGIIQSAETNPSPENAGTNLCFSGLAWVGTENFNVLEPWNTPGAAAFLLPGYWKRISGRDDVLTAFYDVLTGEVEPWTHLTVVENSRVFKSSLPESCLCSGVLWLGENCAVGEDCELENCVILNRSRIGHGAKLRNCLVSEGSSVAPETVRDDKYLTMLGENNG